MPSAGALQRAALPIALYVAWCARHDLLSDAVGAEAPERLLRLKYQDLSPCEFFVPVLHGELRTEHLSAAGRAFTERSYEAYLAHFHALADEPYALPDDWDTYAKVAPWLSERLVARPLKEAWWKFWR